MKPGQLQIVIIVTKCQIILQNLKKNLNTNASYVQTAARCDYYVTLASTTVHHNVTAGTYT